MDSILWTVGILVVITAGILGFRSLSPRVRFAFDILCFAGLSAFLFRHGATPFAEPPIGAPNAPAIWSRLITVAWWALTARVIVAVLYFALHHDRKSGGAKLFIDILAAAIYVAAGLIVLKSMLAMPLGGLVATSGVAAIVIGLALQNTLADVFSGIAVGIEAPFQVGDRISLGNNIEGQVVEMNWRSIRIQTDGADIAIVPNSVVAKLEVVNRSVPSRRRAVSVKLVCPQASDPEFVIDILQEAALLCPSILETPAPNVALSRVGSRWNTYTIAFSVSDSQLVEATKSLILRQARKQLYHACLLARSPIVSTQRRDERVHPPILPTREILGELALFECLQPAQLEQLAQRVETREIEPGQVLFSQDASDSTLYIVASGILEVTQKTGVASVTLGNLGAGEYIGEIGLLTGAPHAATARARTHCYIHQLSREAIEPLLKANPEMAAAFDRSVRRGLALLNRSVAVRATESVDAHGQLLQRIRAFFHFDGTA